MEKLKPCPFCGGKATVMSWEFTDEMGYNVVCNSNEKCPYFPMFDPPDYPMFDTKKDAIKAWNTRHGGE